MLTDIEITFDARAHAAENGMILGEDHEVLPDGEWIRWARRFSGIDDLFVYRHKIQQTFVVAKWIYHPDKDGIGIVLELEAFDQPLDWNPPSQEWVRNRLQPAQAMADSMRKGIRDRAKAKAFKDRDGVLEKHSTADWLDRQGHSDAAQMTRQRKWSKDESPEFESFTQDLQNSAKGRIVTGGT